jgi:hypothetical protein
VSAQLAPCESSVSPLCSPVLQSDAPVDAAADFVTNLQSAEEFSKALASAGSKLVAVYFYATWWVVLCAPAPARSHPPHFFYSFAPWAPPGTAWRASC